MHQSAALKAALVYDNSEGVQWYQNSEGVRVLSGSRAASGFVSAGSRAMNSFAVYLEMERNAYASLGNTKARAEVGQGLDLLVKAAAYDKASEEIITQFDARIEGVGPLGIRSDSNWNATVLSRLGLELAREGRLGRLPVRLTGSAAWVHDFRTTSRSMAVAWQGVEAGRWRVSGGGSASDLLRVGGALEIGIGERRTLRLYGEQEFLQGRNLFRGGISLTIGF